MGIVDVVDNTYDVIPHRANFGSILLAVSNSVANQINDALSGSAGSMSIGDLDLLINSKMNDVVVTSGLLTGDQFNAAIIGLATKAEMNNNIASIQQSLLSYATKDFVQSEINTKLDATWSNGITSSITESLKTYVDDSSALAQRQITLNAAFNNLSAKIDSSESIYAGNLGSYVTYADHTQMYNDNSKPIGTIAKVFNTNITPNRDVYYQFVGEGFGINGSGWLKTSAAVALDTESTIGTAKSLYTDSNGVITGWQYVGGSNVESTFKIYADRFEVTSSTGQGITPFAVKNNAVYVGSTEGNIMVSRWLSQSPTPPSTTAEGIAYFNTTTRTPMIYLNGKWIPLRERPNVTIDIAYYIIWNYTTNQYKIGISTSADTHDYFIGSGTPYTPSTPNSFNSSNNYVLCCLAINWFVNREYNPPYAAYGVLSNFSRWSSMNDIVNTAFRGTIKTSDWSNVVDFIPSTSQPDAKSFVNKGGGNWQPYAMQVNGNLIVDGTIYAKSIKLDAISKKVVVRSVNDTNLTIYANNTVRFRTVAELTNINIADRKILFNVEGGLWIGNLPNPVGVHTCTLFVEIAHNHSSYTTSTGTRGITSQAYIVISTGELDAQFTSGLNTIINRSLSILNPLKSAAEINSSSPTNYLYDYIKIRLNLRYHCGDTGTAGNITLAPCALSYTELLR